MTRPLRMAALASIVFAASALGDEPNLRFGERSLPPWMQAGARDLGDLGEAARAIRASVVLVGSPKVGHGTAFVISRKNRLLATNAHVADILSRSGGRMLAIVDGSATIYKVDRAWYHPGVLRRPESSGGNALLVRSDEPALGPIHSFCPDVAVLRLAADGPELPAEVALADWSEIGDLFARPIGIVGFPGYNKGFPEAGRRVASTYQTGMISRATDFHLDADAPAEDLQFLQHSAPGWFGFSGSPVFLANGHVVALHNSARTDRAQGLTATNSQAVRIDCLRELLAHHKLDDLVATRWDGPPLRLGRSTNPDPGRDQLARSLRLSGEAKALCDAGKSREALDRADEAVRLAPDFSTALRRRAEARWAVCADAPKSLPRDEKIALMRLAIKDMEEALRKSPSPGLLVDLVGMRNFSFALDETKAGYRENIALLEKLLKLDQLTGEDRGRVYQGLAAARWALGDISALGDFNRAVELAPNDPNILEDRSLYHARHGQPQLAERDSEKARALRREGAKPRDR